MKKIINKVFFAYLIRISDSDLMSILKIDINIKEFLLAWVRDLYSRENENNFLFWWKYNTHRESQGKCGIPCDVITMNQSETWIVKKQLFVVRFNRFFTWLEILHLELFTGIWRFYWIMTTKYRDCYPNYPWDDKVINWEVFSKEK